MWGIQDRNWSGVQKLKVNLAIFFLHMYLNAEKPKRNLLIHKFLRNKEFNVTVPDTAG